MSFTYLILLGASLVYLTMAKNGTHWFPGLHPCSCLTNHGQYCCSNDHTFGGRVTCQHDGSLVPVVRLICVTYDKRSKKVVAGVCPYLSPRTLNSSKVLPQVFLHPQNLTKMMCGPFERTDTLCGRCTSNTVPACNSYYMKCIPKKSCTSFIWILSLLARFGPLTAFYLIIFLFRINAAAPYISLLILQAQIITARMSILRIVDVAGPSAEAKRWNDLLIALYSVWNLDVLQVYMPPLCLTRGARNLDSLAFDYLVAFYPLILVLITYCLAELHARRWWCVFWFFWPLVKMFKFLHINIDPMRSIMNTFATFILLSITKFTVVSINLLTFTNLVDVNGTLVRRVPLFDGSADYFGHHHILYATVAIVVLFFFNLLPLLLLFLSPMRVFQGCLRRCCCSFRGVHFVNAFLEVFQGHFKDGVSHRRDYRFVAGLQFLLRILMLAVFNSAMYIEIAFVCSVVVFMLWTVGGLVLRPYKRERFNNLEATLGTYIVLLNLLYLYHYITVLKGSPLSPLTLYISLMTPGLLFALYAFFHTIVRILQLCGWHIKLGQLFRQLCSTLHIRYPFSEDRQGYLPIENNSPSPPPSPPPQESQGLRTSRRTSMVAYDDIRCTD